SYEALVPLLLMSCYGLTMILPGSARTKSKVAIKSKIRSGSGEMPLLRIIVFVLLTGAILVGAYGEQVVADSLTNTAIVSSSQQNVYNAIYWLKDNTPNGSKYLSVSDWRFQYSSTIIGRQTYYGYEPDTNVSISLAKNVSAGYIIVTYVVTMSLPNQQNLYPWNNFPNSTTSSLKLIYTNADVRVYEIL
ncbi:MAG: hypothetical protein M1368_11355, partial [Thaumarchaeota archaeon]|nr:hypothetical protein [Nitrososphaerota archaeon]